METYTHTHIHTLVNNDEHSRMQPFLPHCVGNLYSKTYIHTSHTYVVYTHKHTHMNTEEHTNTLTKQANKTDRRRRHHWCLCFEVREQERETHTERPRERQRDERETDCEKCLCRENAVPGKCHRPESE